MIKKYENNPVIKPSDVNPSLEGYKVVGAFNPGAITYGDEIILLLRVAEKCESKPGFVSTPVCKFENGRSYPAIMEFKEDGCSTKRYPGCHI